MSKTYYVKRVDNNNDELYHWKYIKREKKPNGKWRYYYDKDALKKDLKDKFNSIYNDPNNIYDMDSSNYDEKMKQLANSKEWQDIVKRRDPEYVRTTPDGKTKYLIDDYLVKKKHPTLDVIDDLGAGRKISLNKIDTKTLVAGGKDYIKSAQHLLGLAAMALTEKFKFQQGTYKKEQKALADKIDSGSTFVSQFLKQFR